MIDVHQPYRAAVYDLLNGAITVNSTVVPVFTFLTETDLSLYIELGAASGVGNVNKNKFITNSTLTIEIVHFQSRSVSTSYVDEAYNQIIELLIPTPYTPGFTLPAGLIAGNIEVTFEDHIFEQGLQKVVRKVFRVKCEVEQDDIF